MSLDENIIPAMPEDWFPEADGFVVMAQNGTTELSFAITKEEYQSGRYKTSMEPCLHNLRFALWQQRHLSGEALRQFNLRVDVK